MKKVLSLLVGFVFLQTQTWALSGGPVYANNPKSYIGTYAGVMIPEVIEGVGGSSQMGLFGFAQPETGFATGVISAFIAGQVFTGTIQGIIDPKEGHLQGILDATNYVITSSTSTGTGTGGFTASILGFAKGSIDAKVEASQDLGGAARIEGTATLDVIDVTATIDGSPVTKQTANFLVDGFQQSTTSTPPTLIDRSLQ